MESPDDTRIALGDHEPDNLRGGVLDDALGRPKAAPRAPHSKRFAQSPDSYPSRQRLECGAFSTALGPRFMESHHDAGIAPGDPECAQIPLSRPSPTLSLLDGETAAVRGRFMQTRAARIVAVAVIGLALIGTVLAQRGRGSRRVMSEQPPPPVSPIDPQFKADVFTFARIQYDSAVTWYGTEKWRIDHPDAEWNLSFRLGQLTSMRVDASGRVLHLTDPALFDYPFVYIVEPGDLYFSEDEVKALRQYLLSGGFLMVDDFWGEREWENFYLEIKRVFPEREPQELPLDHPIFHSVFDLKEKPQIPNVGLGTQSQFPGHPAYGITWERPDARTPHYRALFDDRGRMMVVICHNTDLGDGWEQEGDNELYFREFSEKKAYPLGINILFYAMTH